MDSHIGRPRIYVNHNLAIAELFISGIGFGVLTEQFAKTYADSNQLLILNQGRTLEMPLALAWYPRPQMPKYFQDIIQSIR